MGKSGFAIVMALALLGAGCKDKFTLPTSATPPPGANNPRGPAALVLWFDKSGPDTIDIKAGGIPKIGLDSQPHQDASLVSMTIVSQSCGFRQDYEATINNTQWQFNADVTLRRNVRVCNGRAKFAMVFQSKYQATAASQPVFREHWQTFEPRPDLQSSNGVISEVTVEKQRDGTGNEHWYVSFRIS